VLNAFRDVKNTNDFGMKTIAWPPAPPVLQKGLEQMQTIQSRWWAHELLMTVKQEDVPVLEQKVLAYDLFHSKKPWTPTRCWEATYLERPQSPHLETYQKSMQKLFNKYGDQHVLFCDYLDKRNSKNKMQRRALVVTEKNIYKQDPKKFTVAQEPIPLAAISDVIVSTGGDSLILVHSQGGVPNKYPDLLLDLAQSAMEEDGKERVSEFVTVLYQAYNNVTSNNLKVLFQDSGDWKGKPKGKQMIIQLKELDVELAKKRNAAAAKKGGGASAPSSPSSTSTTSSTTASTHVATDTDDDDE